MLATADRPPRRMRAALLAATLLSACAAGRGDGGASDGEPASSSQAATSDAAPDVASAGARAAGAERAESSAGAPASGGTAGPGPTDAGPAGASPTGDPARDAGALFAAAEEALLAAEGLRIEAWLVAEGSVTADVRGTWWLPSDGRVRVDVAGTFMGAPVDLRLVSDGRTLLAGPVDAPQRLQPGPAVREALVLGLTRMGLLHNVAVLAGGRPPDGGDGSTREWAEIAAATHAGPSAQGGPELLLQLRVGGQDVGEARLHLDAAGLPCLRTQTVHFPQGDMHVVERYEAIELGAEAPPSLFEVEG